MKAFVHEKYGLTEVLELKDLAKPQPKDYEVLVKIHATAVNAFDWRILPADPFLVRLKLGLFKPKRTMIGADIAGRVEAVGNNVQAFRPGDAVYGDLSTVGGGGYAEYVAVPESALARKPANLSFEEAAAVPMAALTALQGLRDVGRLQPGQKVLIHGASGGVGTFAIQIAKALGAEVTAVCSTPKIALARKLGADHVIDYTREDFTQNGTRYNLILGVGGFRPLADYQQALTPQGIYVMAGGANAQLFQALLLGPLKSRRRGQKMTPLTSIPNQKDLEFIRDLIEQEKIMPVLDKCFPLHETPEAICYVETGHPKGKVVVVGLK